MFNISKSSKVLMLSVLMYSALSWSDWAERAIHQLVPGRPIRPDHDVTAPPARSPERQPVFQADPLLPGPGRPHGEAQATETGRRLWGCRLAAAAAAAAVGRRPRLDAQTPRRPQGLQQEGRRKAGRGETTAFYLFRRELKKAKFNLKRRKCYFTCYSFKCVDPPRAMVTLCRTETVLSWW